MCGDDPPPEAHEEAGDKNRRAMVANAQSEAEIALQEQGEAMTSLPEIKTWLEKMSLAELTTFLCNMTNDVDACTAGIPVAKQNVALMWLAINRLKSLEARNAVLEAEVLKLREALVDHNDLLRSAASIALREFGEPETTNWLAYLNRVKEVLLRHHHITKKARANLDSLPPPTAQGERG